MGLRYVRQAEGITEGDMVEGARIVTAAYFVEQIASGASTIALLTGPSGAWVYIEAYMMRICCRLCAHCQAEKPSKGKALTALPFDGTDPVTG